jgi:hypothetical protein
MTYNAMHKVRIKRMSGSAVSNPKNLLREHQKERIQG